MIGGDKATLHFVGANRMLNLPSSLIAEFEAKEGKLEHLDILKVWVEKTGLKAKPKSWAFKKKEEKNGKDKSENVSRDVREVSGDKGVNS